MRVPLPWLREYCERFGPRRSSDGWRRGTSIEDLRAAASVDDLRAAVGPAVVLAERRVLR